MPEDDSQDKKHKKDPHSLLLLKIFDLRHENLEIYATTDLNNYRFAAKNFRFTFENLEIYATTDLNNYRFAG